MRRIVLALAFLIPGSARAQQYLWLQTFTPPSTAIFLDAISGSTYHSGSGGTTFAIYTFDGAHLTGSALFTDAIGGNLTGFTLFPHLAVTDQLYALAINPSAGSGFNLNNGEGSWRYDAGTDSYVNLGSNMIGFSTQYTTDPNHFTSTPEPGTLLLMASGLLAIGVGVRRHHASGRSAVTV